MHMKYGHAGISYASVPREMPAVLPKSPRILAYTERKEPDCRALIMMSSVLKQENAYSGQTVCAFP